MDKTPDLDRLELAIRQSWSVETSNNPINWSEANPALGQCAVTACVIQDYKDGRILNSLAMQPDGKTGTHYYNLIDDETVDLTKEQFPVGTKFSIGTQKRRMFASTRDYILSYEVTRQRYDILRNKVEEYLENDR